MTDEGRPRATEIFLAVMSLPPTERRAFLERECGGDARLRVEVEKLLANDRDDAFLAPRVAPKRAAEPAASVPTIIGPYRVLSRLGEGGMGEVFLGERKDIGQRVALKLIKLGMDTRAILARFEAERQALARMQHSNIAKVLDAGATPDGRPYFVMEYVKGAPITRYCDDNKLSVEDRLALFQQVCSGVQHAHSKGVIHRDLTPNNVLVTVQDGKATAKIIDFGLARATDHRLTEKTVFTEQGVILGTPEYMSPEQAGLASLDIDTRTDVYTLGVILYELLTGELPFSREELRRAGYDGMCKTIREKEPDKPSTRITKTGTAKVATLRRTESERLLKRLRGDLDWVVLKCLEKDRTRRYETPTHLADDLQRHLDDEVVLARAPTAGYRLRKLARRYRGQLAAAAVVVLAVVAGLIGTTTFWLEARAQAAEAMRQEGLASTKATEADEKAADALREQVRAEQAEREAREETRRARWGDYVARLHAADASWRDDDPRGAQRHLEVCPTELRNLEWWHLWRRFESHAGPWDLGRGEVRALSMDATGSSIVAVMSQPSQPGASAADPTAPPAVQPGKRVLLLRATSVEPAPCPEGDFIAFAWQQGQHGLVGLDATTMQLRRVADGGLMLQLAPGEGQGRLVSAAIGADSIVGVDDSDTLRVWSGANGEVTRQVPAAVRRNEQTHGTRVWSWFSPDARWMISVARDPTDMRLDVRDLRDPEQAPRTLHVDRVRRTDQHVVAFSPDSERVAFAGADGYLRVFAIETWARVAYVRAHSTAVQAIAWCGTKQLATAGVDGQVKLWSLGTEVDLVARFACRAQGEGVVQFTALTTSGDGRWLAASDTGGRLHAWRLTRGEARVAFKTDFDLTDVRVVDVRWSSDGTLQILTHNRYSEWRPDSDEVLAGRLRAPLNLLLTPAGAIIAFRGTESMAIIDAGTLKQVARLNGVGEARQVAVSGEGRWLAIANADEVQLWSLDPVELKRRIPWPNPIGCMQFDPVRPLLLIGSASRRDVNVLNGPTAVSYGARSRLVTSTANGGDDTLQSLTCYDVPSLTSSTWKAHRGSIGAVAYNADHRWFASGGADGAIEVSRLDAGGERGDPRVLRDHIQAVSALAFSPDGRRLVSGARDGTLRMHDVESGSLLLSIRDPAAFDVGGIRFSPEGDRIAVWVDRVVRLYDVRPIEAR